MEWMKAKILKAVQEASPERIRVIYFFLFGRA